MSWEWGSSIHGKSSAFGHSSWLNAGSEGVGIERRSESPGSLWFRRRCLEQISYGIVLTCEIVRGVFGAEAVGLLDADSFFLDHAGDAFSAHYCAFAFESF